MAISTLCCRGTLLDISTPIVMGILNCTPDSFSDGNPDLTTEMILNRAQKMLSDGASILDLGGQSTRPGSVRIDPTTESNRVIPAIRAIHQQFPDAIMSIDTYHHAVAEQAIAAGASIVNDISGGNFDANMINLVAQLRVPYICMHIQGTPETMQVNPDYQSVVQEVFDALMRKTDQCRNKGIHDLVLDPGFGFGKNIRHNFELLKGLSYFKQLDCPILLGISRKGMIYRSLNILPNEAVNGTTALHMIGLMNGANILRTHDVREAVEAITLYNEYKKTAPFGAV
jgi:dihydropteroate synthase